MIRSVIQRPAGSVIAGVDEAGRGPLAGPVVAAACILVANRAPVRIGDSKQMTAQQREESFAWITSRCIYGVGIVDAHEIDAIGILAATEKAMRQAIAIVAAKQSSLYLLVDGRDRFSFDHPHQSIIRGDSLRRCIGAASIIAKVTRDRIMLKHAEDFPHYGFQRHKGYGTPEHIKAIGEHGMCNLHRLSFLNQVLLTTPSKA